MKVALCLIARLENKYIREYIEYYRNLGFDKIFIYDNNRPDEEKIIDEVKDFVDDGFVDVIDWKYFNRDDQRTSYQDCWDKHHNEYDWIAFFDADEYIVLNNTSNIKDFLSNKIYDGYLLVELNTVNYDDNDIIINDSKTRLDKYTRKGEKQRNILAKSIIRCKYNEVDFIDAGFCSYHIPKIKHQDLICNVDGETPKIRGGIFSEDRGKNAFLKHIPTGCIDDFLKYKNVRKHIESTTLFGLSYFVMYNILTEEKKAYYKNNREKYIKEDYKYNIKLNKS